MWRVNDNGSNGKRTEWEPHRRRQQQQQRAAAATATATSAAAMMPSPQNTATQQLSIQSIRMLYVGINDFLCQAFSFFSPFIVIVLPSFYLLAYRCACGTLLTLRSSIDNFIYPNILPTLDRIQNTR